ncbi:putative Importin beta-3 [Carex littledalei]|uniref:Putative Importin beta-3 n=1 Tax=Carex littledalei TaxID=544730 RepID=A0A833R850_9POAL|nr:putative Importin beta-3 [Carex littledalei]
MLPPPPPPPPVPLDVSDADTERRLNSMCTENPDRFFNNLLDIICSSAADSQRRLQAVLALRHFLRLNSDLKSRLRDDAKVEEETRYLLEELRGAAIELGSYLLPDDSWPEFYSSMAAISPRVRESALFIFSRLAHLIQWQSILPRLDLLRSLIRCSLNIKLSGVDVPYERNAALLAAITLIHIVPPSEDCQKLQDLLPDMISVLLQAFTGNQQEFAKEAVIRLTHLIAVKAQFISPCLRKVLEAMLHIAEFHKVNRELRREAVNLVVTLAKKEPVMVEQQLVTFLGRFVAILLEMLSDMEDDEDKGTGEDAKMFSNALSAALDGNLLVPVLIRLLPGYLEDSDWKKRHAALFFLKEIAKGCVEAMKNNLEQFVKMMVASFKDKHPRVKWAALIAMRELLVDLKPDLEDQYHETIFPALLQVEAAWAAWDFMRWCSKDTLKIYLSEIFYGLYTMKKAGNRVVQVDAILILGFVPTLLMERMGISYVENMYNYIMPNLKFFLKAEISKVDPDRRLCAHSVQRISYIGTGLGKGHFRNDGKEVMEEMMSFKGAKMEAHDPATGDLLKTWMGLLKCLGQDSLPYMELVMPPLLQYAQSDSELIFSNMDNTEVKTAKGVGEKLLDEKASACNMLCSYDDEPQHASSTDTPAASVFRQLTELRTACARARVPLPHVDILRVSLIDSVRFAPQLAELAGSDIAPCLELVRSISWQRLRSDYQQLGRAYSDYAQTLARIELDLTQARQTVRFLEHWFIQQVTWHSHLGAEGASLEVLEHAARLITVCERDLAGADEAVTFYSSWHQECSRAQAEAGAHFNAMLMHDRSRRERIEGHLGRIAKVLEELASYS